MTQRTKLIGIVVIVALAMCPCFVHTHGQTQQEALKQYVSDLQKNPNDHPLREKIIKHVQTMKPKPTVPEDVAMHEGAAEYAFKNAKTVKDFADAAKEYEKALLAAPWHAENYFNCATVYEKI